MPLEFNTLSIMATIAMTAAGGGWWLRSWLSQEFSAVKDMFREHEVADTARFTALELRLLKVEVLSDRDGRMIAENHLGSNGHGAG